MTDPRGQKRDTIRAEGLRLFAERGIDGVSVRDIAAACGMTPSNLYAHYASKEALAAELFHEGYREYGRLLAAAAAGDGPFQARLDRMLRLICALHDEDRRRFRFLVMTQHGYLRDVPRDDANPIDVLQGAVAAAMRAGEIPPRDPALMTAVVVGLVVQPATFQLYGRLEGGLADRAGEIVAACWRALS